MRAYSAAPTASRSVLKRTTGAEPRDDETLELRGDRRGGWITADQPPAERGRQSAGTVHHVAWSTKRGRATPVGRTAGGGIHHTGIIDRHCFHCVYFREPGGVLFEVATEEPAGGGAATAADIPTLDHTLRDFRG